MSDILSDMKTFTVRELDRKPGAVLDTCDREGAVRIRRRDGRSYRVVPEAKPDRMDLDDARKWLEKHEAWMKRTFPHPISAEQVALVDRLIAGE
jgi:hypothetical protein